MRKCILYPTLLAAGAVVASSVQCAAKQRQPNILYILADDLGYGDTGCYGAEKIKTPNIDKLASEGRLFTDAHSASAVSTPSRYALMTGEYPFRGQDSTKDTPGLYGPLGSETPLIIDINDLSLPNMLQKQGYKTACIGKWHLGFFDKTPDWNAPLKPGPNEVGFDYYFGVPLVNSGSPFVYVENSSIYGYDPSDPIYYIGPKGENPSPTQIHPDKSVNNYTGGLKAHELYKDDEGAEMLLGKALSWLDKNKSKKDPFFMYFASTHVHHPFTPGERFKGSSEAGIYGDYAQELDWMIGELLKYLDDNKLRENTIVVVTSDNGGMLNHGGQAAWEHGHSINGDLLGYKFGVWEGGHRVPFIVRWPGVVEAGSVSDQMISNVDMVATFADIVGYELQAGDAPDSYSVLDSWISNTKKPVRDYLILSPRSAKHDALRMGDWIYIPAQGAGGFSASNWGAHGLGSEASTKYTGRVNSDLLNGKVRKDAPKAQLYNLKDDMYQTTNVIEKYPEIAKQMAAKLKELKAADHTRTY